MKECKKIIFFYFLFFVIIKKCINVYGRAIKSLENVQNEQNEQNNVAMNIAQLYAFESDFESESESEPEDEDMIENYNNNFQSPKYICKKFLKEKILDNQFMLHVKSILKMNRSQLSEYMCTMLTDNFKILDCSIDNGTIKLLSCNYGLNFVLPINSVLFLSVINNLKETQENLDESDITLLKNILLKFCKENKQVLTKNGLKRILETNCENILSHVNEYFEITAKNCDMSVLSKYSEETKNALGTYYILKSIKHKLENYSPLFSEAGPKVIFFILEEYLKKKNQDMLFILENENIDEEEIAIIMNQYYEIALNSIDIEKILHLNSLNINLYEKPNVSFYTVTQEEKYEFSTILVNIMNEIPRNYYKLQSLILKENENLSLIEDVVLSTLYNIHRITKTGFMNIGRNKIIYVTSEMLENIKDVQNNAAEYFRDLFLSDEKRENLAASFINLLDILHQPYIENVMQGNIQFFISKSALDDFFK